jgi:hypothetical protein
MLMARKLKTEHADKYDMVFGFANTSQEDERTLVFADRCDREFGLNMVWLEAVIHAGRIGATHNIVDFETAKRNGEIYEAMIQKYGIPNKAYPHCNRELKLNPIRSYLASIGWGGCLNAVGIRIDEPARHGPAKKLGSKIIHPMVSMFPTTKADVMEWWEGQPFDLGMLEHEGNCTWCWKKSLSKLVRQAHEKPQVFDFPLRMEATYPLSGHNVDGTPRVFFREKRSALDILKIASDAPRYYPPERPDENGGCSESCEAFGEDDET